MSISTFESLGLRPLINCRGTYTVISSSLLLPELRQAHDRSVNEVRTVVRTPGKGW